MHGTSGGGEAASIVSVPSSGLSFVCLPGNTVLLAGLAAGVDLPYECASGACGSCRCKLVAGEVESLWPEAPGLSARDRRRGGIVLLCQSRPVGDITVALSQRPPYPAPPPRRAVARVASSRTLTHDMVLLGLEVEGGMGFLPGQFVLLDLPGLGRRAYSMANADPQGGRLDLILKVRPGGCVSPALGALAVGAALALEGPYGRAYFREEGDRPVVGIAGGSGLAPVWSVAQAAARAGRAVHLYVGVNAPRDLCLTGELAALAAERPPCRVHTVVREPGGTAHRSGLVGDAVIEDLPDLNHADVYLAGPPGMVDSVLQRLATERRAALDRVFFDRFC